MSKQRQERRAIERAVTKAAQRGAANAPGLHMERGFKLTLEPGLLRNLFAATPPSQPGTIRPLILSDDDGETVIVLRLSDYAELLRRAGLNQADK